MKRYYSTSEVAKIIGIHSNTVRLYEKLKLISKPERKENNYRVFTDFHIKQFKIARIALEVEVLQNGLRKDAIEIIKTLALKDIDKCIKLAEEYIIKVELEKQKAEDAIKITEDILSAKHNSVDDISFTRKQTANYLNITVDTLRNWELNGLLTVKRKENGYRIYTSEDIRILKIIYSLRCANYSLTAILRMLNILSENPNANIKEIIDTPKDSDDIITVCDNLITSLNHIKENAEKIYKVLIEIKKEYFS